MELTLRHAKPSRSEQGTCFVLGSGCSCISRTYKMLRSKKAVICILKANDVIIV